jgi:hypothetical protein
MIRLVILTILRIIGSKKTERNNEITGQRANTLQWTSKSFSVPKDGHNCAMAEAWNLQILCIQLDFAVRLT